jgi:hypothetical protein
MAFCCGASMIGTKGTLKMGNSHIHNVPLLFCPVCQKVDIHYLVEQEYDLLSEYAQGDGMELDFTAFMDPQVSKELHENCVNLESEHPMDVVRNQIDMALDLMSVAKLMQDNEWEKQLKHRLNVLSQRHNKLQKKALLQKKK